ncbi:3-deoxy-D-manno-octulosonic acid transferase [Phycisphaerae bacterium RAS2]|nr:3-deoxy-D-manno-octulosonic acid transferase [Phycisphaerae bacterium RAS2]
MLPEEGLTTGLLARGERAARPPLTLRALIINLVYFLAAALYLPFLLYQMIVLKKNRRGWRQRLGGIPWRVGRSRCIWVHAVSLGEVNATRALVSEIESRFPDCVVAISATTDTGYAAAQRLYPDRPVFRYPLDFSFAVRRTLARVRPAAIVLMELEVWPNLIDLAASIGVPVCVANGRVTAEKSMRRFRLPVVRGLARRMFSQIAWVAAQDDTYAARFRELGVPGDRVHSIGSMKYDTAVVGNSVAGDAELAAAMGIDRAAPLVVAGSTGPDEEAIVLDAFESLAAKHPTLQLAIIPRKPERFDEVARLIESRGFSCIRRSACRDGAPSPTIGNAPRVCLGDTMGELRKFYALATVVFVGRSLVPLGGSDLMEVAGLGKPMCFGPHVENFSEVAGLLLADEAAVQVTPPVSDRLTAAASLSAVLMKLLSSPDAAGAMGARAQDIVRRNTGATRKTVDLLARTLEQTVPNAPPSVHELRTAPARR